MSALALLNTLALAQLYLFAIEAALVAAGGPAWPALVLAGARCHLCAGWQAALRALYAARPGLAPVRGLADAMFWPIGAVLLHALGRWPALLALPAAALWSALEGWAGLRVLARRMRP